MTVKPIYVAGAPATPLRDAPKSSSFAVACRPPASSRGRAGGCSKYGAYLWTLDIRIHMRTHIYIYICVCVPYTCACTHYLGKRLWPQLCTAPNYSWSTPALKSRGAQAHSALLPPLKFYSSTWPLSFCVYIYTHVCVRVCVYTHTLCNYLFMKHMYIYMYISIWMS